MQRPQESKAEAFQAHRSSQSRRVLSLLSSVCEAPMALGATIHVFDIELADSDRGVYESFELRVARHPSEAPDYLLTRVLAYCLEYTEGISFSSGLSTPDEPTIAVRDLTGALRVWIDVGAPSAERLHRASKA